MGVSILECNITLTSHFYDILLDINDSRIQKYYWNGEEWEFVFNISVRSIMYSIHFPFHTTGSVYQLFIW